MIPALPRSLLLSALAASVVLAGCGAGTTPTTSSTHSVAVTGTSTSVSRSAPAPSGQREPLAKPTTPEEKYEYDANEGRCRDDGGAVRNVGTIDAYCAFPARSNDFHLIETAQRKELAGEEE